MSTIAGRNRVFSWFVGIVCAGVVGALLFLAAPLIPELISYFTETLGSRTR